jgi:NADPH:quinone reductase-like Zn-dependent oxidoreductase
MAPGDGSMAERCAVPDGDVVPIGAEVPDELAAAFGLSGVAAWMALSWRAGLRAGERVLVLGGGGAVGQIGIGVARILGAAPVVAVSRTASMARATAAGADVVVPLEGSVDQVADALAGHGPFDVVLDPVFGTASAAATRCLAERGRLVNHGGAASEQATYSSAVLRSRTASVLGYTNNGITPDQRREAITAVLGHAAAGRVRMQYDVCPLAEVEEVWSRVAAGEADGRCVLVP